MSESIVIALIGIAGAVVGAVATTLGTIVSHYLNEHSKKTCEQPQRDLLLEMLSQKDLPWRDLNTLMHVIGEDEKTTKRLLRTVGARASEDGQSLWGLKTRNPLPLHSQ